MRRFTILCSVDCHRRRLRGEGAETGPVTITLMAHDSFADAVTDETFAEFTAADRTRGRGPGGGRRREPWSTRRS